MQTGRHRNTLTQDKVSEPTLWPQTPLLQSREPEVTQSSNRPLKQPDRIVSEFKQPGIFFTLVLLVLLGQRPKRLQAQLDAEDPKEWIAFRDGLIKRWGTLGITSGLILSATTTLLFNIQGGAWLAALVALCGSIISIVFGTALAFILTDIPGEDLMDLATRPKHMIFVLSIPNLFAMGSMATLYIAITIYAWTSGNDIPSTLAKIGTTGGAVVMVVLFAYSVWLLREMRKRREEKRIMKYNEPKLPMVTQTSSSSTIETVVLGHRSCRLGRRDVAVEGDRSAESDADHDQADML